jgi:hypothetical protein
MGQMRNRWIALVVCVGSLVPACSRNTEGNGAEVHGTADHAARAVGDLGNAAVQGTESVGNGVVCGARELGQTLSGTQGDPHAEAIARVSCDKAARHANAAAESVNQAGHEVQSAPRNDSVGGGPRSNRR